MPLPKFRWGVLVPSLLGALLVLGIIRDVGTTYWSRKSLDMTVSRIAREAALFLPYKPHEAMRYALETLKEEGIEPSADAVEITEEGRALLLRARSSSGAWFAWVVGKPRLYFKAETRVRVEVEGGGPVGAVPRKDLVFAAGRTEDLKPGVFVAFTPAGPGAGEGGWIYAYAVEAPNEVVAVGDVVRLAPPGGRLAEEVRWRLDADPNVTPADIKPASPRLPRLAVVDVSATAETGTVLGFGALYLAGGAQPDSKVRGSLMPLLLEPDPAAPAPPAGAVPADFGLRRAGKVRVR